MKDAYVKSPLNYTGGKYKLLPQLLPLIPGQIDTFVDLFCGGCNVAINVEASKKICNDKMAALIDMYKELKSKGHGVYSIIDETIEKWKLTKDCNESYVAFRKHYNKERAPLDLFVLTCYSFNNQIRYNLKGEFNISFGKRYFNKLQRERLSRFIDRLYNIEFTNEDFRVFNFIGLTSDDVVYCDPPYLITTATYNEKGGWTEKDEQDLLNLLDKLNENGIRFALSNVLTSKGRTNEMLMEWSKKYIVNHLNADYSNCNYQIKDRGNNDTVEVLITNYKI